MSHTYNDDDDEHFFMSHTLIQVALTGQCLNNG